MEWKRYQVEATGKVSAEPCVIEAPSPGTAVEYYLVIHVMLVYDEITCQVTSSPADETKADVLALIPTAEELAFEHDEYHLKCLQPVAWSNRRIGGRQ